MGKQKHSITYEIIDPNTKEELKQMLRQAILEKLAVLHTDI